MTGTVRAPDIALRIATAINEMHSEFIGRGAAIVRATIGENDVMVVLEDIYTPVERTLIDAGHFEQVKETRQAFQMAMREKFIASVEQETGRKVRAFTSQVHLDPDLAVEVFILAPETHS
jgi:uncharacterized protein YbcI